MSRGLSIALRVAGGIVGLLVVAVFILSRISANQILLLPDVAHPLASQVHVEGSRPARGGKVYFVDVNEQNASELDFLFPWLHSNASLVPADEIVAPCATAQETEQQALEEMSTSQRIGAAVALRQLGYHVDVHPDGVVVSQLVGGTNAPCNLQPGDVIEAIDGKPTLTIPALRSVLAGVKPGAPVALKIRRGKRRLIIHLRTIDVHNRAFVGFAPSQSASIKLPIRVSINLPRVGGPSAGLAFALEVMQKLGRKVVPPGYRIAATGEMNLDGSVGAIGGVKQKTYGAREAGVDAFLVPVAGGNAATARHYAGPLRIIPVRTLAQALHALKTLPPKQ